jgi:hypothetical protein
LPAGVIRSPHNIKDTNMSKLIAMVATAVLVNGQRTVIQAGEELPELPEHDVKELMASGAAVDPAKVKNEEEAAALTRVAAGRHFQKEREAVQAAAASTQSDGTADQAGKPGEPAKPGATAKAGTSTKPRK